MQLYVALDMAGTFCTVPEDRCTRHWAVAGAIVQWWVLQALHGKRPSRWEWALVGSFAVLYGGLLLQDNLVLDRSTLSAATMLAPQLLCLRKLWSRGPHQRSFSLPSGHLGLLPAPWILAPRLLIDG